MQQMPWHSWALMLTVHCITVHCFSLASAEESQVSSQKAAKPVVWDDPYNVPDGSIEKLSHYIENARHKIRPRTVLEMRRMNQSLDQAADAIYRSPDATAMQRVRAAGLRVKFLNRQRVLGVRQADRQLCDLLEKMKRDASPQVQAFAKITAIDQRIDRWRWLSDEDREVLLKEIEEEIGDKQADQHDITLLIKLAETTAESSYAATVAELIEKVIGNQKDFDDQSLVAQQAWLEGLVRRLRLPGKMLEVEGALLDGTEINWDDYRGKYVLVGFWATWSRPSLTEVESVKAAFDAYHDKGFEVIGVSLDTQKEEALRFVEQREIEWATLCNSCESATRWNHPLASKYAIHTIPRAILVDDQGKVIHMNLRGKNLHKMLSKLLGAGETVDRPEIAGAKANADKTASAE